MKRLLAVASALFLIVLAGAEFTSAFIAAPTGAWISAPGALAQARSGAASVRLYDGRVLVIGGYGDSSGGPAALASVEAFAPTGVFASVAPMKVARAHATATLLYDGTVLVTGGTTGAGPTATAELYDPFADAWSFVAPMAEPRTRHTATLLEDGRVVVAGGGSVEVYEPWYGTFSFGGVLAPPRSGHAATLLGDGRVLIAGGTGPDGVLADVDAFQDAVGVTAIGAMSIARTALSATTLLDGRVLLAGGRANGADVDALEMLDPATGAIAMAGALRTPRSGHVAFLLPDNNEVLIAGGTSGDMPQASAELYVPWAGQLLATGAFDHPRADTTGAPLDPPGALLAAGGWNGQAYDATAEVYGFATVHTTKGDYAPGEIVPITGAGWQPGETVTLVLSEVPAIDADRTIAVTADAQGRIANSDFSPEAHDVGVRFYLTATGAASQAQVTFTDGSATVTGIVRSSAPGNPPIAGATVSCSAGCNAGVLPVTSAADGSYSLPIQFQGSSSSSIQVTAARTGFSSVTSPNLSASNTTSPTFTFTLTPTDTTPPTVSSITRDGTSPTSASSVTWSVTFSESVTGVDAADFALAATGVTGASIAGVTGGPVTYTVSAGTGSGSGSLGLNLVDNDSIADTAGNKLGGTGAGNGSFTGQVYSIDRTAPTVTATPSRLADHNGWYNQALTITFASTDGDVASCDAPVVYSGPESASASVSGSCTDTAGNVGHATFSFKYDGSGPTAALAVTSGTLGAHGWYTSDVVLHASGTDAMSGIESCTADQSQTAETAGATFTASCTNNAGLSTDATAVTIKLDKTGPTSVTLTPTGTAGLAGWFVSNVDVTTTGADTVSAPVVCSDVQHQTTDTTGAVFTGSCTNDAGLTTSATPLTVKRDATPPTVSATPSRSPDHGGWFNHAMTVAFSATDATSGVGTCSPDATYSSPDAESASVDGTCADAAGNVGNASYALKYDATPPTATLAVTGGTAGAHGWYTSDVTLHTSGADTVSGIEGCTADQWQTTETVGASFHGQCTNGAGLSTDAADVVVKLDKTGPTATLAITAGTAGAHGWYVSDVTLEASGTDTISAPVTCTDSQHQATDTAGAVFNASCTNDAGLVTNATPVTVKLDKTPPVVTAAAARPPDHEGWYNHGVSIGFSATDAMSGVDSCDADVAYAGPDSATASASGTCKDNAGNSASGTLSFEYDATAPTGVTGVPARSPDHGGWFNHAVDVTFSGSDAVSGIASCATTSYSGPDSASAAASGTCTDHAGNTSAAANAEFKYDATAPTGVTAASDRVPDHNGWFNHAVGVTWSGTDATSGIASCSTATYSTPDTGAGSLNGSCTDAAGNTSGDVAFAFKYDATAPTVTGAPARAADHNGWFNHAVAIAFSGTDATSGVASCSADVNYSAPDSATASSVGDCTDNAGNVGHGTASFKYDGTAPTAALAVTGGTPGAHGWYTSDVTLHTSGDDAVSDIEGCTPDQAQTVETTGVTFHGSCTNGAGLTTNAADVVVKLDKTGPTANLAITAGTAGAHGWYVGDVTLETTGADTVSSPVTCTDVQHQTTDSAGTVFTGSCTNDAGLTTEATAVTVKLDKTPPVVTAHASRAADHNGWYNASVTVGVSATDATSGVDSCEPDVTYAGPDTAGATVARHCTDNAGNTASDSLTFQYDATAPTGVSVAARDADHNGWFNHPLAVTWSGNDATSGIASCTSTNYSAPDTAAASLTGSCTDAAGNTSSTVPFAFKYDGTAPSATLAVTSGTPGDHGWYTSDVVLRTSGADDVSGIESCTADQQQTTETTGVTFHGTCVNGAGLSTDAAAVTVKVDKTGPTGVALSPSGTAGKNGWFVGDVTVSTTGAENIAVPVVCTADQSQKADTTGTTFHGNCRNDAGLTTNAADLIVKRDATPPTLKPVVSPSPVVLNGSATATSGADDVTSGVASSSCTPPSTATVGDETVSCTATDNAGNVTTNASVGYSVIYALDTAVCLGSPAHEALQPININGSSVFKQKSTVPVKFRACDANGVSISAPGVVSTFAITGVAQGNTALQVTEDLASTTPDAAFRWSATDQLWIFNLDTKGLTAGRTYMFGIQLNDKSVIPFQFTLK